MSSLPSRNTPDAEPTDEDIRNTLIKENIITNKRVLRCRGNLQNDQTEYSKLKKQRTLKFQQSLFCRYQLTSSFINTPLNKSS